MSFLNLGLGELLAIAGVISAGVVALYLLDRSKRRSCACRRSVSGPAPTCAPN